MNDLDRIPLFATLDPAERRHIADAVERQHIVAGQPVLRRGETGRSLFAVLSGQLAVHLERGDTVPLGPGEVFGEMALLSGLPVSATVVATRDSELVRIDREPLAVLLSEHAALHAALAELFASRLEQRARSSRRTVAFLGLPSDRRDVAAALERCVARHTESVETLDATDASRPLEELRGAIAQFRDRPGAGVLLVAATLSELSTLEGEVRHGDAIVHVETADERLRDATIKIGRLGLGDHALVRLSGGEAIVPDENDRWHFRLTEYEVRAAQVEPLPDARDLPVLDRLARWIARRWVGLALGAGAARGFAHLGVIAALEEARIPLDALSGTSIGGIVALLYAMAGSARGALELAEKTIGSNRLVRRVRWMPRSSFFSGRALRKRAIELCSGRSYADLDRKVSVVACDLVTGQRVVLDRGPLPVGLLATAAVPGALPPVEHERGLLVDGALVNRLPIDLLDARCGMRIAVNVLPEPNEGGRAADALTTWRRRFERPFGFRSVVARSLEILGWWKGAADAAAADVLIEPRTDARSGYDFDSIHELVELGRAAVESHLPAIRSHLER